MASGPITFFNLLLKKGHVPILGNSVNIQCIDKRTLYSKSLPPQPVFPVRHNAVLVTSRLNIKYLHLKAILKQYHNTIIKYYIVFKTIDVSILQKTKKEESKIKAQLISPAYACHNIMFLICTGVFR